MQRPSWKFLAFSACFTVHLASTQFLTILSFKIIINSLDEKSSSVCGSKKWGKSRWIFARERGKSSCSISRARSRVSGAKWICQNIYGSIERRWQREEFVVIYKQMLMYHRAKCKTLSSMVEIIKINSPGPGAHCLVIMNTNYGTFRGGKIARLQSDSIVITCQN